MKARVLAGFLLGLVRCRLEQSSFLLGAGLAVNIRLWSCGILKYGYQINIQRFSDARFLSSDIYCFWFPKDTDRSGGFCRCILSEFWLWWLEGSGLQPGFRNQRTRNRLPMLHSQSCQSVSLFARSRSFGRHWRILESMSSVAPCYTPKCGLLDLVWDGASSIQDVCSTSQTRSRRPD